jgi:hypothetical protein
MQLFVTVVSRHGNKSTATMSGLEHNVIHMIRHHHAVTLLSGQNI